MFKELAISKDLVEAYRHVKTGQPPRPDISLDVKVLQHSVWPVIRKTTVGKSGVEISLPTRVRFFNSLTFVHVGHAI
jgi:hypothetical protein